MSTIRRKPPTPSGMRKITVYGEVPGSGMVIDELDDGATVHVTDSDSVAPPTGLVLNAENLMKFTRQLADWFGHSLVRPRDLREKIIEGIGRVLLVNESRCLDDEIDRQVVAAELARVLMAVVQEASGKP